MAQHSLHQDSHLIACIYNRYYIDLKMYFMSYTHNVMEAEDMIQNLFLKVMTIDTITYDTAKGLLFVMAKRMVIDDARHKTIVRNVEKELRYSQNYYVSSPAVRMEASNILSLVNQHVDTLPTKRAHIYRMNKCEGMTTDEIATELNLSKRTVETHIYLSSKAVKNFLRKIG